VYDLDGPSIVHHAIAKNTLCIWWQVCSKRHDTQDTLTDLEKMWVETAGIDLTQVHCVENLKDASAILIPIAPNYSHFLCIHDEKWLQQSNLAKKVDMRDVKSIIRARSELFAVMKKWDELVIHFDPASFWPLLNLIKQKPSTTISTTSSGKKSRTN
jgi:hypothetical protein